MPRRLAAAAARTRLSALLKEFAAVREPSASIADRAVHIGAYNRDDAVLVPRADFERAVELEELVDDLLLEQTVIERLANDTGRRFTIEEVADALGLRRELDAA
jgi:PHD/YefM family antitoxin component YafN of YafNO toxin-antitoxin module